MKSLGITVTSIMALCLAVLFGCAGATPSNTSNTADSEARREQGAEAAEQGAEAALDQLDRELRGEGDGNISDFSGNLAAFLEEQRTSDSSGSGVETELHRAVMAGSPAEVETLLKEGADPNAAQAEGYTPLHLAAARADSSGIIDQLAEAGADPNAPSKRGFTPLHIALYADNDAAAGRLVWHGADWERRDEVGYKPYDYRTEAAIEFRERIRDVLSLEPDKRRLALRYGTEILPFAAEYGTGAEQAYYDYGNEAFARGRPSDDSRNSRADIIIPFGGFEYLEEPEITLQIRNTDEGHLYDLRGVLQVSSAGKSVGEVPVYLGYLPAGDTMNRSFKLPTPGLGRAGAELDLSITFSEANGYEPYPSPDPLKGRVTVNELNDRTVLRRPELFSNREIRRLVENGSVKAYGIDGLIYNELMDFSIDDILFFARKGAISREVVEGLVADPAMNYKPADILKLAEAKYLSQNQLAAMIVNPQAGYRPADILRLVTDGHLSGGILEAVVVDRRSSLTPADILRLAEGGHLSKGLLEAVAADPRMGLTPADILRLADGGHLSKGLLEAVVADSRRNYPSADIMRLAEKGYLSSGLLQQVYLNSPARQRIFNARQVQRLVDLELFRFPRIGFTYRIDDSDQDPEDPSDGVPDGRIQVREEVDVQLTFKNDSIFELRDVAITVESPSAHIDLRNENKQLTRIVPAAQFASDFELAVKPRFNNDSIDLRIRVSSPDFGDIFTQTERVAVGREVGSSEIRISKRVISTRATDVHAGAGSETPVMADFPAGAEFETRGELGDFYRVIFRGDQSGWIRRSHTRDADENELGTIVVTDFDKTKWQFPNSASIEPVRDTRPPTPIVKPVVVIRNLADNDTVEDNKFALEVEAIDQTGKDIDSIAVWVNGSLLSGSGSRGLKVKHKSRVQESYNVPLRKGRNEIRVQAFNTLQTASEERRVVVESTGIKNPPELYLLAVGVNRYRNDKDEKWKLNYAVKDAETIADIFNGQEGRLYEKVHTRVLTDTRATRESIMAELTGFLRGARRQDVAMIFMAGHGVQNRGTYYFIPHDANPDQPEVNGIDQDSLTRELRSNLGGNKKAIVMLDTCQSSFSLARSNGPRSRSAGTNTDSLVEELSKATGLIIMSAAAGNDVALEDEKWGNGAFTLAVHRGLAGGQARDYNGDGAISWNELQDFVHKEVLKITNNRQRPKLSGEDAEFFPIFEL